MNKILFPSILRGLAAFMVAFNHLAVIFFIDEKNTQNLIHDKSFFYNGMNTNSLTVGMDWFAHHTNISWGLLGVAIFFLISGFVIPFSLEKRNFGHFILNRIVRIIPTATVAIGIGVLFMTFLGLFIKTNTFNFNLWEFISNVTLFRPFTGYSFLDGVTWTLEVEMMFYIIIGLFASFLDIKKSRNIVIISAFITLFSLIFRKFDFNGAYFLNHLGYWITFMLIGTCFYNLFKKNWSKKEFSITVLLVLFFWDMCKKYVSFPSFHGSFNMFLSLFIFSLGYIFNSKLRDFKILRFFSDISYSLYVSHQLIGYLFIAYLTKFLFPLVSPILIVISVFLFMIFWAYILHKLVEKPTQEFSKKIG